MARQHFDFEIPSTYMAITMRTTCNKQCHNAMKECINHRNISLCMFFNFSSSNYIYLSPHTSTSSKKTCFHCQPVPIVSTGLLFMGSPMKRSAIYSASTEQKLEQANWNGCYYG